MYECCEVVKNLIVFECILLNKMLFWGFYLICVVVKFRSLFFVKFMLDLGVDLNIMEFWDEILLLLVIIYGN